jgi:hypothetical protein
MYKLKILTMKKLLAVILLAIFALTGFNSCKKYEDGPLISLRTKKARVVGDWKISKATTDGIDVTSAWSGVYLYFKKDDSYNVEDNGVTDNGKWKFDGKKENLLLTGTGSSTTDTYKIIRLKNKELTIETTIGTQVTRFYLKTK